MLVLSAWLVYMGRKRSRNKAMRKYEKAKTAGEEATPMSSGSSERVEGNGCKTQRVVCGYGSHHSYSAGT